MIKKDIKLDVRGGYRKRKKLKGAQSLLLEALWNKFGGIDAVSKITGFPPQYFINWKLRGRVPLELCKKVADSLKIPILALNYSQLKGLGFDESSWRAVVAQCELESNAKSIVLSGEAPV